MLLSPVATILNPCITPALGNTEWRKATLNSRLMEYIKTESLIVWMMVYF